MKRGDREEERDTTLSQKTYEDKPSKILSICLKGSSGRGFGSGTHPNPPRYASGEGTLLAAGLRVGEAASLTKQDIKIEDHRLVLFIKNAKGGKTRKAPVVDPDTAQQLYEYMKDLPESEPIFRVSKRTLQDHARRIKKGPAFTSMSTGSATPSPPTSWPRTPAWMSFSESWAMPIFPPPESTQKP